MHDGRNGKWRRMDFFFFPISCTLQDDLEIPIAFLFSRLNDQPFSHTSDFNCTSREEKRTSSHQLGSIAHRRPFAYFSPEFWGTKPSSGAVSTMSRNHSRPWGFPKSGIISGPDGESPHRLAHSLVHRDSITLNPDCNLIAADPSRLT